MNVLGPLVLSFESRRGEEMASLIVRHGGQPTVVASMQEIALDGDPRAGRFVEALRDGAVGTVVFLTGVGARTLAEAVADGCSVGELAELLAGCTVVVRGPKPAAVVREWGVRIDGRAEEPNTWEQVVEVLDRLDAVSGRTVAVQEYGVPNNEFYESIVERGGRVLRVPVYRWSMPEETGPLESAIRDTVAGRFELLLFTSAHQVANVLTVAERVGVSEAFRSAVGDCLVGSVGPTASLALRRAGFRVDIEPIRPKMGPLVREAVAAAISRTRPPSSRAAQ